MNQQKKVSTSTGIIIIAVAALIIFGGAFAYQYLSKSQMSNPKSQINLNVQTASWKTYQWNFSGDVVSFEYPSNWVVEKEYYSTPAEQISGQSENIGLFVYPQNNKSDNIHIDGRQNSCDASENHSKCVSKEGHVIFTDSKNQDVLKTFDLFLNTIQIYKTNQTAGWKTYKSNIYDYEINYPSAYKISTQSVPTGASGIDDAEYADKNYSFDFQVFARNADFIMKDCLKDLGGKDITKTIDINGNRFYAFNEKEQGTGGRMALVLGAIRSEYHIIHNNQCYIVKYGITPADLNSPPASSQANSEFGILDQIFSTFKFTK